MTNTHKTWFHALALRDAHDYSARGHVVSPITRDASGQYTYTERPATDSDPWFTSGRATR